MPESALLVSPLLLMRTLMTSSVVIHMMKVMLNQQLEYKLSVQMAIIVQKPLKILTVKYLATQVHIQHQQDQFVQLALKESSVQEQQPLQLCRIVNLVSIV